MQCSTLEKVEKLSCELNNYKLLGFFFFSQRNRLIFQKASLDNK